MKYEKQLTAVATELGLPIEVVREAYFSFWKFMRSKMREIPFNQDLTEEQFKEYRTSFNIPSLGKFTCSYDRMLNVKKSKEYRRKRWKTINTD
jgi:hypothetical protein